MSLGLKELIKIYNLRIVHTVYCTLYRVLTRPKGQGAPPCGFGSRPVVSHLRPVVFLP